MRWGIRRTGGEHEVGGGVREQEGNMRWGIREQEGNMRWG